jgi:hypothetical protein
VLAQALVVEQDAGDDERPRERPTPCLVRPGHEPHAEPAVEPQELLARLTALLRRHESRIAPVAADE